MCSKEGDYRKGRMDDGRDTIWECGCVEWEN